MSARISRFRLDPTIGPVKRLCGIECTSCRRSTRNRIPSSAIGMLDPTVLRRTMWRGLSGGVGVVAVCVGGVVVVAGGAGGGRVGVVATRLAFGLSSSPALAIAPTVAPTAISTSTPAISGKLSRLGGGGSGGGGGGPGGGVGRPAHRRSCPIAQSIYPRRGQPLASRA